MDVVEVSNNPQGSASNGFRFPYCVWWPAPNSNLDLLTSGPSRPNNFSPFLNIGSLINNGNNDAGNDFLSLLLYLYINLGLDRNR